MKIIEVVAHLGNESKGFNSLESAHRIYPEFTHQQTFEDIEDLPKSEYLHLMEFRNGEHYNDLYFTSKEL